MIHPDECIDCYACVSTCPVDAIYQDDNVPEPWLNYIAKAVEWSIANPDASGGASKSRYAPRP
jgi:Fe-S-cluster-containing hydrogenase component 2